MDRGKPSTNIVRDRQATWMSRRAIFFFIVTRTMEKKNL